MLLKPLPWACFAININLGLLYFDSRVKYTSYVTCVIMQTIFLCTCTYAILHNEYLNEAYNIFIGYLIYDFCAILMYGNSREKLMYFIHHTATLYTAYFCYTYLSGETCDYYNIMFSICYECLNPLLSGVYVLEHTENIRLNYTNKLIQTILMFIVDKLYLLIRVFCTTYYLYKIFEIKGYFIEMVVVQLIIVIMTFVWYPHVYEKYKRIKLEFFNSV